MKIKFLFLSLLLFSTSAVWAEAHKNSEKWNQLIKRSGLEASDLAISIGTESFEHNSRKKMIPASISKIVTAAAFLKHFPPGTKLKTRLVSRAGIVDGTLKGDLFLVGGGDPSFVSENMWFLVNHFLRTGVKKIQGDLVVDDSLFDSLRFDPSRQKERVDRAYDAPVGAMSFNWNSMNIFIRPGPKVGDAAQVFIDPENPYVRLVNKVKTSKSKTSLSADRQEDSKEDGDVVVVSGQIGEDVSEQVIFKNITQPDLWALANLKSFLSQRGISITGQMRRGTADPKANVLGEVESKPMADVLADMNKFSNNFVAEMLCKNLASQTEPKSASLASGMKVLRKYLNELGVPESEYNLVNPSGLTRENRISSSALVRVLKDMDSNFQIQPEFLFSLPIAGVDGTLKKRMKDGPAERWVRAKTGFINGVVSLAGFAGHQDGRVIPFVFIYNGNADESKVRKIFDEWATDLVKE